jgi:ditrans,polycis-polyprenyl diphosphate synthase
MGRGANPAQFSTSYGRLNLSRMTRTGTATLLACAAWFYGIVVGIISLFRHVTYLLLIGQSNSEKLELSLIEKWLILPLLRFCRIPKHAAFIMDGNRRFARSHNEHTLIGHRMGYDKLRRVLLWCFELGVTEVSVYAFSMDNFSRTQEEVDYLMDLAETKLETLCEDGGFVMNQRIRVRICGDTTLLRPSLQEVIRRVESKTVSHEKGTFNILLAYSSKRELAQAVDCTLRTTPCTDVSWKSIQGNLYNATPVDLLVRTSGETRLSDFLIWQLDPEKTVVVFVQNYWPEYSLTDLAKSLLKYHIRLCKA